MHSKESGLRSGAGSQRSVTPGRPSNEHLITHGSSLVFRVDFWKPGLIPKSPDSLPISRIRDDAAICLMFLPFLPENDFPSTVTSAESSSLCPGSNVVESDDRVVSLTTTHGWAETLRYFNVRLRQRLW
jgi:hypothetical protein